MPNVIHWRRRLGLGLAAISIVAAGAAAWRYLGPLPSTQSDVQSWYRASQGSRLLPLAWFEALERPGGSGSFADEAHLTSFGYIAAPKGDRNRLPIGFTRDVQSDEGLRFTQRRWLSDQKPNEPWLGLNCSACHTGAITHKGTIIVVDGGQGMGDLQSFLEALNVSIKQTLDDAPRFERFAQKVLGSDVRDTVKLRTALNEHYTWLEATRKMNETPLRSGFGRVDAFGHIFNKTIAFANPDRLFGYPSDAPVSYPFLWNAHKQRYVQYNGIAENVHLGPLDYGALGRNSGQVVGVFGDVIVRRNATQNVAGAFDGYASTLNVNNLSLMERFIRQLSSPKWPASFPAIDQEKAKRGEALYDRMCASCHLTPSRQAQARSTETISPIRTTAPIDRTDVWMACNAVTRQAPSGLLEGTTSGFINVTSSKPLAQTTRIDVMLATIVRGALVAKKVDIARSVVEDVFGTQKWDLSGLPPVPSADVFSTVAARNARMALQRYCETHDEPDQRKLLAYKARPLDGIWATAPYLHNGSVPSLHDLLLPAKDRPKRFWVSREFDPVTVGMSQSPPADALKSEFRTVDDEGRVIFGNSSAGHEYGVGELNANDRSALLEYLKTL